MELTEMYSGFKKIKTTTKKVLLLSFFCGLWVAPSYADEYLLVMSKDDPLCQEVRLMYNKDLRKHGEIMFENHEEYNWLKWDEEITTYDTDGHKSSGIQKIDMFDINNDSKDEAVIFTRLSLSGALRDGLSTFPLSIYQKGKELYWSELQKVKLGYISGGATYKLRGFPPKSGKDYFGRPKNYYIDIGHFMFIRPMKVDENIYISLFGSEGQGPANIELKETNISVVSKYGVDNKLEDICYFIKAYSLGKGE